MFRSPSAIGVGAEPQAVAAGDVNGDGLMDLVSANGEDDDLSIVLGHPSGQFVPGSRLPVGTEPGTLVVTDLDGDGVLDIAVANEVSD
ncbi:MAG: FG-GAP repeat domain-containing protein, partial [Planctomycetota bacterium]